MDEEIRMGLNGVRGEEFNSFNKSQLDVVTTERRSVGCMKNVFLEQTLGPPTI